MCSYPDSDNGVLVLQINSGLQRAQLELLSAHGVTHQLRLHYSVDDLARFGHRDVLRKSAAAAGALNDFYSAIEKKIPEVRQSPDPLAPEATENAIAEAVQRVAAYLLQEREHYASAARPLRQDHKARMWPYFSAELLEQVRMVELEGERVPAPPFYAEARAQGFDNLPELTHMDSLTFVDVVVFNEKPSERSLFHALVHAVQFQILGLERYTELFVQGFLRTKAHFTVPLEAHAFSLTSQFMRPSPEKFSVEDHVLRWIVDDRY
jgi:hypothetical protein